MNMTYPNATWVYFNGVRQSINFGDGSNAPLDPENRDYAEIMRQVAAGTLTILEPS